MKRFSQILVGFIAIFFFFILFPAFVFADTTPFRSASNISTDSLVSFTNLENCSVTDGNTCNRATATGYGNLYFKGFGNYGDFGMPSGSKITKVRIRVTGKASTGIYVGLFISQSSCQSPSDLWTMWQLAGSTINTQTFVTNVTQQGYPQAVLTYCLEPSNFENTFWRINYSSGQNWSANIDNFEIAFDYGPSADPIPTPLFDLPWDYEGKGLSFNEAALAINSYFDHDYPLLSSGISEPADSSGTIVNYLGFPRANKFYSSHDGYDYGSNPAKVHLADPVLAAADGIATYINTCSACGNMIVIDHGNGYQTRYLHLQKDGLITGTPGAKVNVSARQKIGQVGATGYVIPEGEKGAHIHFGVFQDKNNDGNFEDNVPDGATDPFGWQSKDIDPWETYIFFLNDQEKKEGKERTGNKSNYLWKKNLDHLDATLTANGGVFNTERYKLDFPQDAANQDLNLDIIASPIVKTLDNLSSIGSTVIITVMDSLGNLVTSFEKEFTLTVDFNDFDLTFYNTDTLSIYSSIDAENWTKEGTIVDFVNKTASARLNHLTHFALMAEKKDITAPITTAVLDGQKKQNWYKSDVSLTLNPQDNEGGVGVDYTLYKSTSFFRRVLIKRGNRYHGSLRDYKKAFDKTNREDWETYNTPLVFSTNGHHKIEFYSVDIDGNIESTKTVEFDIDKTLPETSKSHFGY